ncbi:exodeoxyribonuclease VII large subunit [Peptococcaceae bacterium]|nr:exodeoxyribonuclease VII large subunit [Peptococcaceae bacterium]
MSLISVSELTKHIKNRLDQDYLLANVWVKGEISNFKQPSSGHIYFTLKDDVSQVRAVMFRSKAGRLLFEPKNGMAVTVRGYISVYERDGCYQLYIERMEPDGVGALYLAFEQLKAKLQREGLFSAKNKKTLPKFPASIGIVTSPTGAVIKDILEIIARRWPLSELILAPVSVQGENAPLDICRGIEKMNQSTNVDVIIVGRGGGSLEELWAFNTEIVARALYNSRIPIISAVGHETDITIADYVADVRAITPSAAAEMVVPDRREIEQYLQALHLRSQRAITHYNMQCRHRLQQLEKSKVFQAPGQVLTDNYRQYLDTLQQQLSKNMAMLWNYKREQLGILFGVLHSLSPLATLSRGYSFCTMPNGQLIKHAGQVKPGSNIKVTLHQGKLTCVVQKREVSGGLTPT